MNRSHIHWPCLPLSEAFWFQEGPGVRKWQFTNSGIKLLNVGNIEKEGTLNLAKTDRHLSEEEVANKYSHFLVDAGDLVIASSGISFDDDGFLRTRGAFVEKHQLPLCLNTSTIRFKAIEGVSDLCFLRFWLNGHEFRSQITKLVTGTAQQNFGPSHLKAIKITLPPLEEQKRIAKVLDRAQSLISKRREAIAQLDTLIQALFIEMFGDPVTNPKGFTIRKIKDLLESASYGTSEKSSSEGEFPVLRMNNITRTGEIDLTDLKYMDLADSQKERYLVRCGDVLFNRTNSAELVGKTAIIRNISNPMAFAGYLVRLRVNKENDPEYLSAFLNTNYSKRVLRGMCKSIIGMANINATEAQTINIAQPPLHLQQEFARRVEAIEKLKTAHRASLSELDTLFASLQHRAFRGEL
ncbi:restriction endonuclease subunit S [Microcoleus sp. OTE_8_concoct_300]|uniref:restriction endonuclease subunit S n=1 Tax=Microcoleus sp. OTE_8_concoct_300 TaxID=2964710 RepID=UPI00403FA94B